MGACSAGLSESQNFLWVYRKYQSGEIGVFSFDALLPGTMVVIGPSQTQAISVFLVFSRMDNPYYYGFQFAMLSHEEQQAVQQLIRLLEKT